MWVAVGVGVAGAVGGAASSADASRSAANKQADAAREAAAQQQAAAAQNIAAQKPWLEAGTQALGRLSTGLAPGGEYAQKFTMADAAASPAEQVAQQRASQAIQNSAAARGGLIGSNVLDQLQTTAGDIGAQYQNQAFNQWNTQQNRQLGAQQSLAGIGQTSAANVAGQTTAGADAAANAALTAGGAQAGSQIAQGSAIGTGLGQLGNILGQSGIFNPASNPTNAPATVDTSGTNMFQGAYTQDIPASYGTGMESDERLKTDIENVGATHDGLPIYKYRMKAGGPKKMGVMAQDVEKVTPSAVATGPRGFKMVDYGKVS